MHLCGCVEQAATALCCYAQRSALLRCSAIQAHPQKDENYVTRKTLTEPAEPMYMTVLHSGQE